MATSKSEIFVGDVWAGPTERICFSIINPIGKIDIRSVFVDMDGKSVSGMNGITFDIELWKGFLKGVSALTETLADINR
ncbi:MAG: hypothetical protein V2A65_01305 [Candidatus Omnitrophota bacterium]